MRDSAYSGRIEDCFLTLVLRVLSAFAFTATAMKVDYIGYHVVSQERFVVTPRERALPSFVLATVATKTSCEEAGREVFGVRRGALTEAPPRT